MNRLWHLLSRLHADQAGQATTEYAVLTFITVFACSFLTVYVMLEAFAPVFEYVSEIICLPFP